MGRGDLRSKREAPDPMDKRRRESRAKTERPPKPMGALVMGQASLLSANGEKWREIMVHRAKAYLRDKLILPDLSETFCDVRAGRN